MNPETSSSGAGATPTSNAPATGTTTTSPTGATPTGLTHEQALAKIAELEHSHRNAVEERDRHRKKLTEYERKEQEAQQAALTDAEKLTQRATAAEERAKAYQQRLAQAEVKLQAQALGIIDPELAALAIQSQVEYGEDGQPKNVETVLKALIQSKPWLAAPSQQSAKATPTAGGATNPARSTNATTLSWETISQMTAAEYEARRGEIQKFIATAPPPSR